MKQIFSSLQKLAAVAALAALASCSHGSYTVLPKTDAYHDAHRMASTRVEAAPQAVAATEEAVETAPAVAVQPTAKAVRKHSMVKKSDEAQTVVAKAATQQPSVAATTPQPAIQKAKLNLAQKTLVAKITKKAGKLQARQHHNVAETNAPASKAGRAAIVALVGLLLLVLGGAAGVGILALIGLLALIVGLIMLIVALING